MASSTDFRQAERAHNSVLASIEKKALIWLATRMPAWVNSDHLTIVGFISLIAVGLSYWYARYAPIGLLLVIVFFATNWFGDSLDGTLARLRNCQRPRYGFYVDHLLDSFGALFVMGGLALSGYINPWVAVAMLVAFLLLSIEVYLTTYTLGSFRLSYGRFGPTEIRIALAIGNLALFWRESPRVLGGRFLLLDVGGVVGTAGMIAMLLVSAAMHIAQLYREERLR